MNANIDTKEITQKIFSLDPKNIVLDPDLQEDTNKFVMTLLSYFPDDSQIRCISKELKNQSFDDVINKYFNFPIIHQNLDILLKDKMSYICQGVFEIFSLYTFYTWISMSHLFFQKQKDVFVDLLSVLNNIILFSKNNPKMNQYHTVSILCFLDLINTVTVNDAVDNYDLIFREMTELFSENEKLPPESDQIIEILSNKVLNPSNQLMNYANGLINSITQILYRNPYILSQSVVLNVIKLTKSSIINLDLMFVKFFINAANYISMNDFKDIFKLLMISFLSKISSINHNIENKNISIKPLNIRKRSSNEDIDYFHPPPDLYQINNIDDEQSIFDFKVQELKSFIDSQILQIMMMIKHLIVSNAEYTKYFVSESFEYLQVLYLNLDLMDTSEEKYFLSKRVFYDQCAIVFYLVSAAIKKFSYYSIQFSTNVKCILFNNKIIFDPNVTFFSQDSNFEIINSLRHFIFHFLLENYQVSLIELLKTNSIYLDLFHECIYRLIYILKNETNPTTIYKLCLISDYLIFALLDFRINLNPSHLNDDNNDLILLIRKTILFYFNLFLNDESLIVTSFSSPIFCKHFFTLILEPPIRKKFIYFLYIYLTIVKKLQKEIICSNIIQVFNIACTELKQEEAVSLLLDFLNTFNKCLFNNNELLVNTFEPISTVVFNIIMDNNVINGKTEQIEDLLISLLNFLVEICNNKEAQSNNISKLESTIHQYIKNKPENKIMQKFVHIITGEKITDSLPIVEIKQSKILCSFIRVFLETSKKYDVIEFITNLCSFSRENRFKCHAVELDLELIDIISKFRKSEEEDTKGFAIDKHLVNLLLYLFSQIAAVVSSSQAVHRFFSLFRLLNSKYLSSIHKNIIYCFNQILVKSRNSPPVALPMYPQNMIDIQNVPVKSINDGFSFVFWILTRSVIHDFIHNIIIIEDNECHSFIVNIIENAIQVKIQSENNTVSYDFKYNIPIKTWTMITITSIPNPCNLESIITFYINKEEVQSQASFPIYLPKKKIKCILNHSDSLNKYPPLLGPFMLSKVLSSNEISSLNEEGIRSSLSSIKNKIIFAYALQHYGDYFVFDTLYKLKGIYDIHDEFVTDNKLLSFPDLIVHNCDMNLVLPIFGVFGAPLKDGSHVQLIDNFGIEILINLFKLGVQFQESFYTFNGFFIIAHHLQNSDKSHISFQLYEKYYNLLEMISFKKLQMQIIDAILMNLDMWSVIDIKEHAQIFENWNQKIYNHYKNVVNSVRSLEWFLFIIHQLYNPLKLNDQTLLYCRKLLFEIIRESYKYTFTQNDLTIIIGFISSSKTPLIEKKEMINYLVLIIQNEKVINEANADVSQIIPHLFAIYHYHSKDDEIIELIFYLFIIIYKLKKYEMKIPLYKLVQNIIISLHINQSYFYQIKYFPNMISLINMNKAVEFFPMLCINAIFGGEKYLEILLNDLDRNHNYFINEQSPIYSSLLMYAFYPNKFYYNKLIESNISLFENNLDMLINAIDIIGYSCYDQNDYNSIKHDVLYEIIVKKLAQTSSIQNIIFDFIFLRPNISKSSILNHFINQHYDHQNPENSQDNNHICNSIETVQKLNEMILNQLKTSNFELKFGLRFSESDGKWLDLDISKSFLSLYQNNHFKLSQKLIPFVIYFIHECDQSFAENMKKSFESLFPNTQILFNNEIKSTSMYLNFFTSLFSFLNSTNTSIKKYAINFIIFNDSCLNEHLDISEKEIEEIIENKQESYKNKLQIMNDKNKKIWTDLWNSLTSSRSPWSESFTNDYTNINNLDDKGESNVFIGEDNEEFHEVIRRIGEGSTSILYQIIDTRTQKVMCKKVLKTNENYDIKHAQDAIKEFEILKTINHPCICHAIGINTSEIIYDDHGQEKTTIALFLEYFENKLEDCLDKNVLNNTLKTKIIVEIAQGMSFIHMLGMIYHDLRIANIMLDSNYNAKLIDFGLAKIIKCVNPSFSSTSESYTKEIGTLDFMSPEMINSQEYDNKTDVYSFGIVLYCVFIGNCPQRSMSDQLNKPIPLPSPSPSISKFCLHLITKCTSIIPKKRPSFNDIIQDIRNHSYLLADDVDPSIVSSRDQELEKIKISYRKESK